jgi:hypothetical protein
LAWFSVHIETRGDDPAEVTGDQLGDLVNALVPHSGVVIGGADRARWGATVSVEADSAVLAVAKAAAIVRRFGADVFLPDWPVVRAEAVREDVLDEELARPS